MRFYPYSVEHIVGKVSSTIEGIGLELRFEGFNVPLEDCPDLVMFTGKGGVGKTTCAAAAAIALADQGSDTLLLSTDPAHSITDSLGAEIGFETRAVPGVPHLWAVEIDAGRALARFRHRFGEDLHDLIANVTYLDDEDMGALLGLEIPGLDELMGLHQICGYLSDQPRQFRHMVWDSAPTGHTLRLLELPHLIDHWVKVLANITWKYREFLPSGLLSAPSDDGDVLLEMKRIIGSFVGLMRDPQRSRLVPVTVPEPMAGAETLRLIARLRQLRIPIHFAVVNGIHPENGGCPFCSVRRREMVNYLSDMSIRLRPLRLVGLAARPVPIRGADQLRALRAEAPPAV